MKHCPNPLCTEVNPQELNCFGNNIKTKDGLQTNCKSCQKRWRNANKQKCDIARKKWRDNNPGKEAAASKHKYAEDSTKHKAAVAKWRAAHHNEAKELFRQWQKNNPDKCNAHTARRRAARLKATPKWLTKEQFLEIREFYTLAQELQWLSEEPLQVDHIHPLQGENFCGLHVPWNLQILPRSINSRKKTNSRNNHDRRAHLSFS